MKLSTLKIDGNSIGLDNFYAAVMNPEMRFEITEDARIKMKKSRDYIETRIDTGEVMYGVNTGFGAFSSVRISDSQIEQLQKNLIRSHCVGIGKPFTKEQSKGMMILRANTLARGHSGVRVAVVEKIIEFLNADLIPVIPEQGSVGASGDLAPLSHLALALIGEGEIWGADGKIQSAFEILTAKKIAPLELKAKEGLSLINGCQVMNAVGLLALHQARDLMWLADLSGAMSLEGLRGSRKPFDPLIADVRPHAGEAPTARNLLKLMGSTSEISESHAVNDPRVQDAYSLRCMPAVHGSVKMALKYVQKVLEIEANSSTDNPLVFSDANKVLSCGNFHGMPVSHALDFAGIVMASLASISQERISKLISTQMSELPPFLAPNGGLNSGHMIVQVAAASLVSENKVLAHPASVDSIPTSAEKEDHVSMGTIAARKFQSIVNNVQNVIAMELLSSTQALNLIAPLKPAAAVSLAFDLIRKDVPFASEDRIFAKDVTKINELISSRRLINEITKQFGELEC
ncbi:MAG: histidine ammonia-lyase [Bdellovibrionales bacterium RIFCSPHIGHO2_01_FULL_40_29]|nr:MAG: histidine ammonia-lyase [Bdellovibrionales bacterium RIFCSPHIGHO2_01_FULL_40_29]OFZ33824.1 MAG: histidine ammonia-lyase [Bdellovibrionales bacterium RIFCSPHIGHO2_02_FULL_40_15]